MWAIESQNEEIVRSLLAHGVDANWKNHMGETALDHATASGLENIVKLLRQTTTPAEQGGAGQPSTAPESNSEGEQKPKPESEVLTQ